MDRTRIPAITSVVFAVLQLVALARYPAEVEWGTPQAWVYFLFLGSMLLTGTGGAVTSHRRVQ